MGANIQDISEARKIKIVNETKNKRIYIKIKRLIDIIGALIGCIILVPLTIIVWIANFLSDDNGPIFYVQKRVGLNGKAFKMYKFRSMVINADKKLKRYLLDNPDANEEFLAYRKLKNDPRITKVGKFIRKTSIDEFPQFINVLKGDMSLVGPRPYLPREKRIMKKNYNIITKVKPGLTGPWQVNGRSDIKINERMKMDIEYVENESLLYDAKFLFKTIGKILKRNNEGAV